MSLFGWKFPVTDSIFLVLISISLISCRVQSNMPIVGVITEVAKVGPGIDNFLPLEWV